MRSEHAAIALAGMRIGVIVTDAGGLVCHLSPDAERLTGWTVDEAVGLALEQVLCLASDEDGGDHAVLAEGEARLAAEQGIGALEEGVLVRRDGQRVSVEYSISTVRAPGGEAVESLVVGLRDIGDKRLMSLQLARAACRDPLTGLLNRQAFFGYVAEALHERLTSGSSSVMAFMDVDELKLINNTCGHRAGDELLDWIAALLRETVGARDVVARLGGDEFAILFDNQDLDGAVATIETLQRRMSEFCFTRGDKSFMMSASFGVAELTREFSTVSDLLSAVDQACYMAKDTGRGGIQIYQSDDLAVVQRLDEMNWVAHINHELRRGRSLLYAQHIHRLDPAGADEIRLEVLLRLTGPDGQILEPGDLIRAAERFGLMSTIDRWVIRSTFELLAELPEQVRRRVARCFINVSGLSVKDSALLDFIRDQLAEHGIPPQMICFEITETVAVQSFEVARWFIQELGSIGCGLALDDFGTGAASYAYLRDLPVDYVKIDGSFVDAMASSELDRKMVESIHQICHLLGIRTVAEAVGNEEVLGLLEGIGIDYAQGFFFDRPAPMAALADRVG
jgi:diguanylate cyclase (GGDEF)-like protein/PAS domain S-box-containing protein